MNDTITAKNYKKLILQVSTNKLAYCCIDTLNSEIKVLKTVVFTRHNAIEEELTKAFNDNSELSAAYDETLVLHDNSFNTLVPKALFDETYLASYLQYNTKVFETDFFAFDAIGSYDINNVYVPFMNVNNFLIDRFGSFDYKNTNSILVAKLLDASKNREEKQVYVHVQDTHFEIIVAHNQKLLLYNSFEYTTPEDFLYYLLFTMEQLSLNPESISVLALGKITDTDPCFELAYKYIRNIALYDTTALSEKYTINNHDARQHFILLNA